MSPLYVWVLTAMLTWAPPDSRNVPRLRNIVAVASAIVHATDDPEDASLLASIAYYETGGTYSPGARGKLGEVGPWQLMTKAPKGLDAQAVEALKRWHEQGPCGYTGEAANPKSKCPLARHRIERALMWRKDHPLAEGESPRTARM